MAAIAIALLLASPAVIVTWTVGAPIQSPDSTEWQTTRRNVAESLMAHTGTSQLGVQPSSCTNNFVGGACIGSIRYTASVALVGDVRASGSVVLLSNVVLTTNGYNFLVGGDFNATGASIVTGYSNVGLGGAGGKPSGTSGSSLPNSFGGSGGGGGAGYNGSSGGGGGSTEALGGVGGTKGAPTGGNGSTPSQPTITTNLIQKCYLNNDFQGCLSGGGGGQGGASVTGASGAGGGKGAFGLYMQANRISLVNTTITANGQTGENSSAASNQSNPGSGGGGGGGFILLAYNGLAPGASVPKFSAHRLEGGRGGFPGNSCSACGGSGGRGGDGQLIDFSYSYIQNWTVIQPPLGTLVNATSNLVAYFPLNLTNKQTSPSSSPFQQKIQFNPLSNAGVVSGDLGNIRFCADSRCGHQLYAWLENCFISCSSNSTLATVWVKIDSSVPSRGNLTIYMALLSKTTEFDGVTWGEAPQLTTVYGVNDNGASVFSVYNNGLALFALTSLGTGGSASVTTGAPAPWSHTIMGAVSGGSSNSDTWTINGETTISLPTQYIAQTLVYLSGSTPFADLLTNFGAVGGPFYVFQLDGRGGGHTNLMGYYSSGAAQTSTLSISTTGSSTKIWYQMTVVDNRDNLSFYQSPSFDLGNLGTLQAEAQGQGYSGGGIALATDGGSSIDYWTMVLVRTYPPAGVMPSVSFGSEVFPKSTSRTSVICTPAPVVLGSPTTCGATVAGASPIGYVKFSTTSTKGAFAPAAAQCSLTSSSCSVTYTDTAVGNPTITASYLGDSGNDPSSGTFPLAVSALLVAVSCSPASITISQLTTCTANTSGNSTSYLADFLANGTGALLLPRQNCTLRSGSCGVTFMGAASGSAEVTVIVSGVSGKTTVSISSSQNTVSYGSGSANLSRGAAQIIASGNVGITIQISNSSASDGVAIGMVGQLLSTPNGGIIPAGLSRSHYYDLAIIGVTNGNSRICVVDSSADTNTTILYWNSSAWAALSGVSVTGTTVCGSLSVTFLHGTNLVAGDPILTSTVTTSATTTTATQTTGAVTTTKTSLTTTSSSSAAASLSTAVSSNSSSRTARTSSAPSASQSQISTLTTPTSSVSTGASTTTETTGGGIPEFPSQVVTTIIFTFLVGGLYLLIRQGRLVDRHESSSDGGLR